MRLGSVTFEITAAGTTVLNFVDPNPSPGVTDNGLGDSPSTDLDAIIYRNDDVPRTINLRINSVDENP